MFCVCFNRGLCKGPWDCRDMKVSFLGVDNFDLYFEGIIRVKARRVLQTRELV